MAAETIKWSTQAKAEDDWPATVYRYVEHYKFEPQHLLKGQSTAAFRSAVRRQEVPLNFLLNMLLVALPSPWIQKLLNSCDIVPCESIPPGLVQRYPAEINECQPDVRLETATDRVFIESKVKAYSDTTQVLKYLYLSAYLDQEDKPKRPWLIYVTPGPFFKRWNPVADRKGLESGGMAALRSLVAAAELSVLGSGKRAQSLIPAVDRLRSSVVLGHLTWGDLGAALSAGVDERAPGEMEKPTHRIARDFLVDLERRSLWKPPDVSPIENTIILEIGAEGGSITVVSRLGTGGVPEYSVRLRDQTLTFLSEDEAEDEIDTQTEWSTSWEGVMVSLARWPWPMLYPMFVHKDYAAQVLAAVEAYRDRSESPSRARSVERWRDKCLSKR